VSLDYSGIELRTLGVLSGDERLIHDCIFGDLHLEIASGIAGRKLDKVKHKELRQAAKAVSFGIVYGIGARGLAAGQKTTVAAAQAMIDLWAERYPEAFNFRYKMQAEAKVSGFLKTAVGGTIYVGKKASLPRCANYPVQRAAFEAMACSIIRHKARLDKMRRAGRWRTVRMIATIHDALIDEAPGGTAPAVLRAMKEDMTKGWLDVFPGSDTTNLVEGGIGYSWATLE